MLIRNSNKYFKQILKNVLFFIFYFNQINLFTCHFQGEIKSIYSHVIFKGRLIEENLFVFLIFRKMFNFKYNESGNMQCKK